MPDRRTFLGGTGLAAAAAALPGGTARTAAAANLPFLQAGGTPWWRGQPHAHANPERFGPYQHLPRSTPFDVIKWYATHNYNFAVAQIGPPYHQRCPRRSGEVRWHRPQCPP